MLMRKEQTPTMTKAKQKMAINPASFKTRTVSSLAFVLIMLAGVLINQWTFYFLFLVIHCAGWLELQKLFARINPEYFYVMPALRSMPVIFGTGLMLYGIQPAALLEMKGGIFLNGFAGGLMLTSFLLWIFYFFKLKSYRSIVLKNTITGLLYLSLTLTLLFNIRSSFAAQNGFLEMDFGLKIILTLLCSIWINDTMQYIVGSLIGKTPFSKISPKKTWEGTLGGIVLCIAVTGTAGYFTSFLPVSLLISISAIAGIFGTMGDLFESKIKRKAGVKDSGNILPGHGGFLDRFDSFIFSIPAVWASVYIWLAAYARLKGAA